MILGSHRQADAWGSLASLPHALAELKANERSCLKNKGDWLYKNNIWGCPLTYMYTWIHMWTHTNTNSSISFLYMIVMCFQIFHSTIKLLPGKSKAHPGVAFMLRATIHIVSWVTRASRATHGNFLCRRQWGRVEGKTESHPSIVSLGNQMEDLPLWMWN